MPCLGQLWSGPGCCPPADRSPESGQDRLCVCVFLISFVFILTSHCISKLAPEPASQGVIGSFVILTLQPGHLGGRGTQMLRPESPGTWRPRPGQQKVVQAAYKSSSPFYLNAEISALRMMSALFSGKSKLACFERLEGRLAARVGAFGGQPAPGCQPSADGRTCGHT